MRNIIISLVLAFVLVVGAIVLMVIHYQNQEVTLRNQTDAQQTVCTAHYDKMWKSIQQVAQIPDIAKNSFKEMYEPLIRGRYGADSNGVFMKWIQEQNPNFDWSLYANVQKVVEAQRASFFDEQRKLVDIRMQHTNLLQKYPGKWFLGDKDTIAIVIITSEKTAEAYRTGQENDVDLLKH